VIEEDRVDAAAGLIVGQRVARDKLDRAKALRREGTRAERMLWRCLRGNQLAGLHFRRQQVVDGLILDLYCHSARLAVEVDGEVHEAQVEYDGERERAIARRGIRVLRVRNEQVEGSLPSVLGMILGAAEDSVARLPEEAFALPESGAEDAVARLPEEAFALPDSGAEDAVARLPENAFPLPESGRGTGG